MHSDYYSDEGGVYFGTDEGPDFDGTCLYLGTEPEPESEEGYPVHDPEEGYHDDIGAVYYGNEDEPPEDEPPEDEEHGELSVPQISPESTDVTEPENPYTTVKFTFTPEDLGGYVSNFEQHVYSTTDSGPNPPSTVPSEPTMNSCFFDFLSPDDGTGIPPVPQKCDYIPYNDVAAFLATVEMPETKDFGDVLIPDRLVIPLVGLTDPTHLTEKLNKTICQFTQTLRGVFEIDNQTFFYRATLGLDKPYEAIVAVSIATDPISGDVKFKHRENQYDITVLVFALRNEAHDSHFVSLVGEVYLNLIPDQTDQKLSTLVVDSALCIEPIVITTTEPDLIRYVRQIFADMTLFGAPLVSTD